MNEESHDYAVVEFIEEECTAVVPLQRISGFLKQGEMVNVLWNNRKEYSAKFFLSGNQEIHFWTCEPFKIYNTTSIGYSLVNWEYIMACNVSLHVGLVKINVPLNCIVCKLISIYLFCVFCIRIENILLIGRRSFDWRRDGSIRQLCTTWGRLL